jgi:hypothetical protein
MVDLQIRAGAAGGSGIVIIRAPGGAVFNVAPGTNTINYITSPSRRLQSSYIYSIRNTDNINNLCTFNL